MSKRLRRESVQCTGWVIERSGGEKLADEDVKEGKKMKENISPFPAPPTSITLIKHFM